MAPIPGRSGSRRDARSRSSLRLVRLATLLFLAAGAAGCGALGRSPEPGPTPPGEAEAESRSARLAPSPASRRSAERVELTGLETGTMWTFENPPLAYWDSVYDFRPDRWWLTRARLASLRFGDLCSASFVSQDGLVMTNHHCARQCAEAISTAEADYVELGFHAGSRTEELVCPDLSLDQLLSIEDVTARVRHAAPPAAPDTAAAAARRAESDAIVEQCEWKSELRCEVVSLYQGGQYQLYRYRRYEPVKLVFLPELQAGFFGGDPDNFTYPRYALDVAFVRAYRPDGETAAYTPYHLRWRRGGAEEGEPVFITGHPGSTSRLATVSQLMYEQAYRHPFLVQLLEGQRAVLRDIAARGPEAERAVRDQLFSVENSLKAFSGQLAGLRDTLLIGRKIRWEERFRDRIRARPELEATYGDLWNRLERLQERKLRLSPRVNVADPEFLGGPYELLAGMLVRYVTERALPEEERDPAFRGETLEEVRAFLLQSSRPDPQVAADLLTLRLQIADRWLDPDDPLRAAALRPGEGPAEAARRIAAATRILDPEFRRSLLETGARASAAADDPLLRLAEAMERTRRELQPTWEEVVAAEEVQEARLAEALFAAFGTDVPPDATFTLRITDGVARRYPYNGTIAAPFTTFHGMYERAAAFGDEAPWTLPAAFRGKEGELELATPLNFVTTNDITGGNSGSPVVDRQGRVVGVAFDGNIEQLPNEFLFRTEAARTVAVHAAGILEALRVAYGADALVAELLRGTDPEESEGR